MLTTGTLQTVADQGHTGATATVVLDAAALATATPLFMHLRVASWITLP
jgi:hypothetical protein